MHELVLFGSKCNTDSEFNLEYIGIGKEGI